MSRPARPRGSGKREIDEYRHDEAQRLNNPEAGLARYETEKPPTKRYGSDPRMDLQLVWAGKAERASFEVDIVIEKRKAKRFDNARFE
jgi:adenine-specific DNA-methyltransferase